ncbi:MAG: hypothetical protein AAF483_15005 [Planctomycetota bacterium]
MSVAFFLENRAHQLRKICTEAPIQFNLPQPNTRSRLPEELRDFFDLVTAIIDAADEAGKESVQAKLLEFEREIVRLRFSSNDAIKQPAVQLIKAIFADAEYFSGLKPLPQYTDTFAYELLFPSWLNLLTAVMLPRKDSPKPRLEGSRQGTLFEFLGMVLSTGSGGETQLVGFMTFIASRFDAPLCEEMLQRLAELYSREGVAVLESIDAFEPECKDAKQFARRLHDFLTVKHSMYKWPTTSEHPISYKRPLIRVLPDAIIKRLRHIETTRTDWDSFFKVSRRLRFLINSDNLLTSEYNAVLEEQPQHAATLLRFVISGKEQGVFLAPEGQTCLAFLIAHEIREATARAKAAGADRIQLDLEKISGFAEHMAPRLADFGDSTIGFFCKQLLQDAPNRKMILEACISTEMQIKLAEFVLNKVGNVDDDRKFLDWLACISVISPTEEAKGARAALQALTAVVQNRSIGNKEFGDLVGDIQANYGSAMQVLSAPIMAAGGKSPRLASLYMTLNEITETYSSSGKADNFSVVRAKYSRLTNM